MSERRARASVWAGLALVSLATLCLQVSLTRIFSLLIWYHFAFLAVALALLGFTAGGLLQARPAGGAPGLEGEALAADLARRSLWFSGSIGGALLLVCQLPLQESVLASPGQFFLFLVLIGSLLVPFYLAGGLVAATLASHRGQIGRLYLANLLGSGVGCVVSVAALDRLGGGPGGVLVAAGAAALAAAAYAVGAPAATGGLAARAAGVGVVWLIFLGLAQDPLRQPFYLPNAKLYPRVPKEMILSRTCTSIACVDFFNNPLHFGLWGISSRYKGPLPAQVGVVIDAWAVTSIMQGKRGPDGLLEPAHPVFEALPPSLVFQFLRATGREAGSTLVIGAGGGLDVRTALHFGAKHVDAIDINPTILGAVAGRFDAFAGGLYHHPKVNVVEAEGRHYLRSQRQSFDVIQISGVDTFAASQAGAFALSENYLYTTEALREYLDHLSPDGTLAFTRWLYKPPRQDLRLCVIIDEAMKQAGIGDAADRVLVIAAPVPDSQIDFSVQLVRRQPFSDEEVALVKKLAEERGFSLVYAPRGAGPRNPFSAYFASTDRAAYIDRYPFEISPSTDDKPFFFEHARFGRLFTSRDTIFGAASGQLVLLVTFLLVAASGAFFLGFPVWKSRLAAGSSPPAGPEAASSPPAGPEAADAVGASDESPTARWQLYFALLGAGYMGVEMAFVPRFTLFLGNPSYALSVVLFALLTASGLGAALGPRLRARGDRSMAAVLLAVAALLVAYQLGLGKIFDAGLWLGLGPRVVISVALVGLPAFLMGTAFPAAIDRAGGAPGWVTRAWVVNGYASVVTSVGATIAAMAAGFSAVLLGSAACYLVAAWVWWAAADHAPARAERD
jgi:hypothetical protein